MIRPQQIAAARVLAGLSQERLAQEAGVGRRTLQRVESGQSGAFSSTIDALRRVLEKTYHITFLGDDDTDKAGVEMNFKFIAVAETA